MSSSIDLELAVQQLCSYAHANTPHFADRHSCTIPEIDAETLGLGDEHFPELTTLLFAHSLLSR